MRTPPNLLPCWTERTNMPTTATFHSWLGTLFGHSESQVLLLLDNKMALQFLVAWSLFESKCFAGYVRAPDIAQYAQRTAPSIGPAALRDAAAHFHARYQDRKRFENLMHGHKDQRLLALLGRPFDELTSEDRLFLLVFVVFRYRNNIFHGNKGVESWLFYREQIQICVQAMQILVSHAEQTTPTMKDEAA